jgi:nicotinate phosphoribosyltransferase
MIIDPINPLRRKRVQVKRRVELHQEVVTGGKVVYRFPRLEEIRRRRGDELAHLHESYRRLLNAHEYKVGLTSALWDKKERLLKECMLPAGSEEN